MSQAAALDDRGLPAGYPFKPDWEVTPREAQAASDAGEALLIDVRNPAEVATCAIGGAVTVPLNTLPQQWEALQQQRDGKKLVIFCHHGGRSLRATEFLREQGIEDVVSMAGGIDLWAIDLDPSLARY